MLLSTSSPAASIHDSDQPEGLQEHSQYLYLSAICTLPSEQGKGLGGKVMNFITALADELQVWSYLEVRRSHEHSEVFIYSEATLCLITAPLFIMASRELAHFTGQNFSNFHGLMQATTEGSKRLYEKHSFQVLSTCELGDNRPFTIHVMTRPPTTQRALTRQFAKSHTAACPA